ncbi:Cuticlin-6 [Dirofilaria immitis]
MSPRALQISGKIAPTINRNSSTLSKQNEGRKKDSNSKLDFNLKQFENEKIVTKEEATTIIDTRISRPTPKSLEVRQKITKEDSTVATSTARKKNQTLLERKNSKKKQLEELAKNSLSSELSATQMISSSSFYHRQKITKNDSILTTRTARKKNQTLLEGKKSKEKQLEGLVKSSSSFKLEIIQTTPNSSFYRQSKNTTIAPDTITTSSPDCEIDAIVIIDSSGSVEETFSREKELAAEIINRLRIGPNNAHVALIKFAAKEKVKTVWSFKQPQEQRKVLQALLEIPFSSGTTAIHAALLQAVNEYSLNKGARPRIATPFVFIFTDGFGQKDTTEAATLLRDVIPNIFAIAVGKKHPINEDELRKITGSNDRVFMDNDIEKLYGIIKKIMRTC